jgi:hypothetical protein
MVQPDWTEVCRVRDLEGNNYLLRASDDPNSPWKLVIETTWESWRETLAADEPGHSDKTVGFAGYTAKFEDGTMRLLNLDDEVEIGKPPD